MENLKKVNINFEDVDLKIVTIGLNNLLDNEVDNFAKECFYIYKLKITIDRYKKEGRFYVHGSSGVKSQIYSTTEIYELFGYTKKTINLLVQCYNNYVKFIDNVPVIEDLFKNFTRSKLMELLPLSKDTIITYVKNGVINCNKTVKDLRAIVKDLKKTDNSVKVSELVEPVNEEDLEELFDYKKVYDFTYFTSKSKEKLQQIAWTLYTKIKQLDNN